MGRLKASLSQGLLVWLAAAVLLMPLRWVAAWAVAVCVHELGHLAVLRLMKLPVYTVDAGLGGARITTDFENSWQEVLCALAGPVAGLLLLLAAPFFPRVAVCGALQSLYNLLPVYPLDGGRIIHRLTGEKAGRFLQKLCLVGLGVLGIYGTFVLRLGPLPLLAACFTGMRALVRKIPCKESLQALQ